MSQTLEGELELRIRFLLLRIVFLTLLHLSVVIGAIILRTFNYSRGMLVIWFLVGALCCLISEFKLPFLITKVLEEEEGKEEFLHSFDAQMSFYHNTRGYLAKKEELPPYLQHYRNHVLYIILALCALFVF